jgi:hypothetical protein
MDKERALNDIRNAWIAGFVSSAFILFTVVVIEVFGLTISGVSLWSLIAAATLAGLAYGVYRKSRIAAVALLSYFMINQVLARMDDPAIGAPGLFVAFLLTYLYARGVTGTFIHHRLTTGAPAPVSLDEELVTA